MSQMPTTDDIERHYGAQPPRPDRLSEPAPERYARQTRNAAVFMAWVAGVWVVVSLIAGLVLGIGLVHAMNQVTSTVNGGSPGSSNCYSQGGTDITC